LLKIRKKIVMCVFAIILCIGSSSINVLAQENPSLNNFATINSYRQGQFIDVPSNVWFTENVATAYELGLMKGNSPSTFNPSGNVTLAETIAMAARIHSIYLTGTENFEQGTPWYQVYVDYALDNNILDNEYVDYSRSATRAEFAQILSNSLPEEALSEINIINENAIPDVPSNVSYAASVYKLYRAGILTGNDSSGTFTPAANIGRNAAAAIVTRMADSSLRKSLTLIPPAKWHTEGMYKVGYDIPAGEYFVTCTSEWGAYLCVSSDSSGSLDSIITNDNFDVSKYITLSSGQYFEVTRGKFTLAESAPIPTPVNGIYGEGMYKVGRDIPAGEYLVTCTSEWGAYLCVSSDSSGSLDSIITNDNFDVSKYITLSSGQYFEVVRGNFTLVY